MMKIKFDGKKGLIDLPYKKFLEFCQGEEPSINVREARLIPLLKTGDEGALTSIFLSAVKLIKEYRDYIFKEVKLPRSGNAYFYTEVSFKDIDAKSRLDGLIIIVSKGVIKDALVFEMKNKNNPVEKEQVEKYISLCKKLGISKMVTVSNDFVSDSSQSPVNIDKKLMRNFSLYHFSWTYLMTKGQILLFKNETNIEDEDQVEIMKEVLHYIEAPASGVSGYHNMKSGWKATVDKINNRIPLKVDDSNVIEAVESWHEEERDMALLLSRELGVFVKSTSRSTTSIKEDATRLKSNSELFGNLSIKNSVSDIKIRLDFEVKTVSMTVKVTPPQDKGTKARITWITKQLENAKKKNEAIFQLIEEDLLIEADIKHAREHIRVPISSFELLIDEVNGRDIQSFNIVLMSKFKGGFGSNKKFIVLIEKMILEYYAGIVQYLTNWNRPAPKL